MRCPYCGFVESKVIDTRPNEENETIRRRRECLSCMRRFTTYETIEHIPLLVVKKDGTRQAFDRNKVLNSLILACDKRTVTLADQEQMIDEVEQKLQNELTREVSSRTIGMMVMDQLRNRDQVAYVRFASVYRQFTDVSDFVDELRTLLTDSS